MKSFAVVLVLALNLGSANSFSVAPHSSARAAAGTVSLKASTTYVRCLLLWLSSDASWPAFPLTVTAECEAPCIPHEQISKS